MSSNESLTEATTSFCEEIGESHCTLNANNGFQESLNSRDSLSTDNLFQNNFVEDEELKSESRSAFIRRHTRKKNYAVFGFGLVTLLSLLIIGGAYTIRHDLLDKIIEDIPESTNSSLPSNSSLVDQDDGCPIGNLTVLNDGINSQNLTVIVPPVRENCTLMITLASLKYAISFKKSFEIKYKTGFRIGKKGPLYGSCYYNSVKNTITKCIIAQKCIYASGDNISDYS